jgi:predicted transcriptional regulator
MATSRETLQDRALDEILKRPQTSWELAQALDVPFEAIQPRTTELRKMGLIVDSGDRSTASRSGKAVTVWKVAA